MFYDRFIELCRKKCVSPSRAAIEAGISKSLVSKWKNNAAAEPSGIVLKKLSDYFDITVSELLDESLTSTVKEKTPTLTAKDERDIANDLENALNKLSGESALMFDGEPLDDETRELLRISLENQFRMAKIIAKEKYTPKKYRKGKKGE